MPLPPDDLDALVRRREAQARAASEREVARILALPDPAERMRAYAELSRVLAGEGETLLPDATDRILQSLRGDGSDRLAPRPTSDGSRAVAAGWARDRRKMALLHGLRPVAAAGCTVAAVMPFAAAAWRWGWTAGEAAGAFLALPWGLLGVALAIIGAGIGGRMAARTRTVEGLFWLLIASFVAGVAGLAVAVAAI